MSTKRKQSQVLSIKGSTKICTEFFEYSVNNILYQRGIYPPEDFKMVKKYGLTLWTSADESLQRYINQVMKQVSNWMLSGQLDSLALIIMNRENREVVERWQFDIEIEQVETPSTATDKENQSSQAPESVTTKKPLGKREKTPEEIQRDIQDIMRQITSSVTFLPSLQDQYTFTILTYAKKDVEVPKEWIDSDPHMIVGDAEQVKLRSFSTNRHKVNGLVAYRLGSDMI